MQPQNFFNSSVVDLIKVANNDDFFGPQTSDTLPNHISMFSQAKNKNMYVNDSAFVDLDTLSILLPPSERVSLRHLTLSDESFKNNHHPLIDPLVGDIEATAINSRDSRHQNYFIRDYVNLQKDQLTTELLQNTILNSTDAQCTESHTNSSIPQAVGTLEDSSNSATTFLSHTTITNEKSSEADRTRSFAINSSTESSSKIYKMRPPAPTPSNQPNQDSHANRIPSSVPFWSYSSLHPPPSAFHPITDPYLQNTSFCPMNNSFPDDGIYPGVTGHNSMAFMNQMHYPSYIHNSLMPFDLKDHSFHQLPYTVSGNLPINNHLGYSKADQPDGPMFATSNTNNDPVFDIRSKNIPNSSQFLNFEHYNKQFLLAENARLRSMLLEADKRLQHVQKLERHVQRLEMLFKKICCSHKRQQELDSQIQLTVSMPSMTVIDGQMEEASSKGKISLGSDIRRTQSQRMENSPFDYKNSSKTCFSNENLLRGSHRSLLSRSIRSVSRRASLSNIATGRPLSSRTHSLDLFHDLDQRWDLARGYNRKVYRRRFLGSGNHRRYTVAPQRTLQQVSTSKSPEPFTPAKAADSGCGDAPLVSFSENPKVSVSPLKNFHKETGIMSNLRTESNELHAEILSPLPTRKAIVRSLSVLTSSSSRDTLEPTSLFKSTEDTTVSNQAYQNLSSPVVSEGDQNEEMLSEANSDEVSMGSRANRFLLANSLFTQPLYARINKLTTCANNRQTMLQNNQLNNGQIKDTNFSIMQDINEVQNSEIAPIYNLVQYVGLRDSSPQDSVKNGSGSYEGINPPTPPIRIESSFPRLVLTQNTTRESHSEGLIPQQSPSKLSQIGDRIKQVISHATHGFNKPVALSELKPSPSKHIVHNNIKLYASQDKPNLNLRNNAGKLIMPQGSVFLSPKPSRVTPITTMAFRSPPLGIGCRHNTFASNTPVASKQFTSQPQNNINKKTKRHTLEFQQNKPPSVQFVRRIDNLRRVYLVNNGSENQNSNSSPVAPRRTLLSLTQSARVMNPTSEISVDSPFILSTDSNEPNTYVPGKSAVTFQHRSTQH